MKTIPGITFKYIWKEIIDGKVTHIVKWKSPMLDAHVQDLVDDLKTDTIDLEYHTMG